MEDEIHWCWSQCCDLGPHACICGNDCEEDTSMMNKHTPTTEEVRDAFAIRKWDNFQRNYPNSHDKTERDAERQRFDRWLAQVKAEALRDAAEALDNCTDADVNNAIGRPRPTYSHSDRYADVRWLELRADQIEEDDDE